MTIETVLAMLGDSIWTIAFFLIAIMIIVFVHEFGHYIVGRWSGIHAEVFSLGFGKVIFSRVDKRGTRWQLAAVPLGGYVKFLGDANASSANPDEETLSRLSAAEMRHTLHGAPLWARAATVLAGPMFNVLLTIALIAGLFMVMGVEREDGPVMIETVTIVPGFEGALQPGDQIIAVGQTQTPDVAAYIAAVDANGTEGPQVWSVLRGGQTMTFDGPALIPQVIGSVLPKTAASRAGLMEGDAILVVDGKQMSQFEDISDAVKAANGADVDLTVWRAGQSFMLKLTPEMEDVPTAEGAFERRMLIGIRPAYAVNLLKENPGLFGAVKLGAEQSWYLAKTSVNGIVAMIGGQISTCNMSGAISMAQAAGQAAERGIQDFVFLLAALSLGIGIMNLFPIPVLDGGHLMFHAWEAVTGKPPSNKALARMTMVGLAVVLGLMVYALRNDLVCV